ncbi:diguanylate cyclase [Sulfurimonas sp. HSL-1716]|uniref:diguanylate cyclase n=1 Tax=Hydrocurvibacter sulfurireducens TaxID=3131937 RepID=UPI0031F7E205
MNNHNIMDIATKNVLTISENGTIRDAIESMYKNNHRDVVVVSESDKKFGLLSAADLIKMKKLGLDFNQKISSVLYPTIQTLHKNSSVFDAINRINCKNYPMCVVDDANNLVGFVSYYDIISSIDPNSMLERRYIGEVLIGSELKKASQEMSLCDIIGMMDDTMYDCVILMDENNKAVGIITTKDVIRFFNGNINMQESARLHMISPLLTVDYNTTIKDALSFIKDKHFKRLIITNSSGDTIGQITQEELLARIYSRWAEIMRTSQNKLEEVNKVLNEKASQYEMLSATDKLTGIYNRGKFEVELNSEIQRAKRYKSDPFSIIFFDVDNFKRINDTYGHPVGDVVLKKITNLFKTGLRATDVFARWGGEEFAIIMPNTILEKAAAAAEKLRQMIEKEDMKDVGCVTCSFGVSEFLQDDEMQSIIIRTDNAMYKAKRKGKNKVVIA